MATTGVNAMPIRGERLCPKFDPTEPRAILRYFEDLEQLFGRYSIVDDADKKSFTVRYPARLTEDAWRSLPAFRDGTKTYNDFKAAILKLYPGTDLSHGWTMADLDALVGRRARVGPVHSYDDYLAHHVEALPIIQYLLDNHQITHEIAGRVLTMAVSSDVLTRVERRLESKFPDYHADRQWTFDELHEALSWVLQRGGRSLTDVSTYPGVIPTPAAATIASSSGTTAPSSAQVVKREETADILSAMLDSLRMLNKAVAQQSSQPNTFQSRPQYSYQDRRTPLPGARGDGGGYESRGCFYCGNPSHTARNCKEADDDVAAGKIERNWQGRIVLPGDKEIPDAGRNIPLLRDRVNIHYDKQKATGTGPRAEQMVLELEDYYDDYYYRQEADVYEMEVQRNARPSPRSREVIDYISMPPRPRRESIGATSRPEQRSEATAQRALAPTRQEPVTDASKSRALDYAEGRTFRGPLHPYRKAVDASNALPAKAVPSKDTRERPALEVL